MKKSLLAFGEVLFDVIGGQTLIGGATLNVAAHFVKQKGRATVISALGKDDLGATALEIITNFGIDTTCIKLLDNKSTGIVDVTIDKGGQPTYDIRTNVAWDHIRLEDEDLGFIRSARYDCIYFGTLAQRSDNNRMLLYKLLTELNFEYVFFDVNLRQAFYSREIIEKSLTFCNILKLNDEEFEVLSKLLFGVDLTMDEFSRAITEKYNLEIVIITKGADGALVRTDGELIDVPGVKIKVVDTVGAGDSFSAAFLNKFLSGKPVASAVSYACQVGAYVASCAGAVPKYNF